MTISSLKDLDKLLKLLRTQGVKTFELNGIKLELNDSAPLQKLTSKNSRISQDTFEDSLTNIGANIPVPQPEIPTDGPSENDLLFWSTQQGEQ